MRFGKGQANDIDLTQIFDGLNARRYWRVWAFDTDNEDRWQLHGFDIKFGAPKIIEVEAHADAVIGENSGVSLDHIGLEVVQVNGSTESPVALAGNSTFKLYSPGEETPVSFTLGGLDALLTSLEGKTLNGQWECVWSKPMQRMAPWRMRSSKRSPWNSGFRQV